MKSSIEEIKPKKFYRTFHLPWSLGATSDDKTLSSTNHFVGKEIVIIEKLDGENSTIYKNYYHARSLDSKHHWSRDQVKALQAELSFKLSLPEFSEIHRICGENLTAIHSIEYSALESFFYVFGIFDINDICYSFDDTKILCDELNLFLVPELLSGTYLEDDKILTTNGIIDLKTFKPKSMFGDTCEGYVIRLRESFAYEDSKYSVAKFVRENHVQTNTHWMHAEPKRHKIV